MHDVTFKTIAAFMSAVITFGLTSSIFGTSPAQAEKTEIKIINEASVFQETKTYKAATTDIPSLPAGEVECIASAVWHEAGNQPQEGQVAVAEVIITRAKSKIYPNQACAVIKQKSQFSFVKNGYIPPIPRKQRDKMLHVAKSVIAGQMKSRVKGSMYFHATYASPNWKLPVIGRIGSHIFYGKKPNRT